MPLSVYGSVGVGKPYFVDIVQNVFARFVVVLTVALQDFKSFEKKAKG